MFYFHCARLFDNLILNPLACFRLDLSICCIKPNTGLQLKWGICDVGMVSFFVMICASLSL